MKHLTEEHKRHISETHKKIGVGKWMKNIKITPETRKKMADKMRGKKRPPFNEEWKRKIGEASKGRVWTKEALENLRIAKDKYLYTNEYREKQRIAHLGEKSVHWKGGITPINRSIRASAKYALWRTTVFKRDNYTCVIGGKAHGSELHADHIKPFALFPELRFDLSNGRTLCVDCHKNTETWGYTKLNVI